jgi:hypothetical protein
MAEQWVQHDGGRGPVQFNADGEPIVDPYVTIRIRVMERSTVLAKGNRYRASQLRWVWKKLPDPGDVMEYFIHP